MRFQLNFGTSHPLYPIFSRWGQICPPPSKFRTKNAGRNRVNINDYEGYDYIDQEDERQASEDGVLGILPELDHDPGAI